jgi:hypothetical protein
VTVIPWNSPLARLAKLAGDGSMLTMTARFGRSPVRDAACRLREWCPDLDLKLSWHHFGSLVDWGNRWQGEQDAFAAGLIFSAAGDPIVERAVGRCLADLARLGRPLLWGAAGHRIRWQPRFKLTSNGHPGSLSPDFREYARLGVAHDTVEFYPRVDPNLYATKPDFSVSGSRLHWSEARLVHYVMHDGKTCDIFFGPVSDE